MTDPTGIHLGIPDAVYHADALSPAPSLSSTLARIILDRSPRHAWVAHPRLNQNYEPTESATFDVGRASHRAVLGQGGDYIAIPGELLSDDGGVRSKEAKAWVADARADGLTPLKPEVVGQIGAIAEATRSHLAACGIVLDPARSEVTALARLDGVWCRARVDNAPSDPRLALLDLKTTTDASPEAVIRSVASFGYDRQLAFYRDVWEAATGERRKVRLVMVEKEPPYACSVVELYDKANDEADWFTQATAANREAIRIWGECLTSGHWPGYPARVAVIGAPGWHLTKMGDRAERAPKPSTETLARATAWQAPEGVPV
jgi:PDDEXK-like domain of unknown function (DUF3799)